MKKFRFPNKIQTVHYPLRGEIPGLGTMMTPGHNEMVKGLEEARRKMGKSKSSYAKYITELGENGEIWTEIIFTKLK